jgi:hypothetical protein
MRIGLAFLFFALSILISYFLEDILSFFVVNLSSGWVFTTIYVRLLVIIAFAIFLNILFSMWKKTAKMKFWVVFLIALGPGFGISFISPIYQGDYGYTQNTVLNDLNISQLQSGTDNQFELSKGNQLIAFFTSGCPHCKNVSQKLGKNIEAGQEIPVYAFFPGPKENSDTFIVENGGEKFTHFNIVDSIFMANAGVVYPSTYLVDENGKTINQWTGDVINFSTLDFFLDSEF